MDNFVNNNKKNYLFENYISDGNILYIQLNGRDRIELFEDHRGKLFKKKGGGGERKKKVAMISVAFLQLVVNGIKLADKKVW